MSKLSETVPPADTAMVSLVVNGEPHRIAVDPRASLLDVLREDLHLTGTKRSCDHGQCGACTVLVNGRRVLSCLTLALMHSEAEVTTIEGLARDGKLHPLQQAFLDCDALQCGACTPGQIMSALGALGEPIGDDNDTWREALSGNLCRCGAYPNILAAIRQAQATAPAGGND